MQNNLSTKDYSNCYSFKLLNDMRVMPLPLLIEEIYWNINNNDGSPLETGNIKGSRKDSASPNFSDILGIMEVYKKSDNMNNVEPVHPYNIKRIPLGLADPKSDKHEGYKFT